MGDLTSALEEARAKCETMHIVSLNVCRAFESIPHSVILEQLSPHGVKGRLSALHILFSGEDCSSR